MALSQSIPCRRHRRRSCVARASLITSVALSALVSLRSIICKKAKKEAEKLVARGFDHGVQQSVEFFQAGKDLMSPSSQDSALLLPGVPSKTDMDGNGQRLIELCFEDEGRNEFWDPSQEYIHTVFRDQGRDVYDFKLSYVDINDHLYSLVPKKVSIDHFLTHAKSRKVFVHFCRSPLNANEQLVRELDGEIEELKRQVASNLDAKEQFVKELEQGFEELERRVSTRGFLYAKEQQVKELVVGEMFAKVFPPSEQEMAELSRQRAFLELEHEMMRLRMLAVKYRDFGQTGLGEQ